MVKIMEKREIWITISWVHATGVRTLRFRATARDSVSSWIWSEEQVPNFPKRDTPWILPPPLLMKSGGSARRLAIQTSYVRSGAAVVLMIILWFSVLPIYRILPTYILTFNF